MPFKKKESTPKLTPENVADFVGSKPVVQDEVEAKTPQVDNSVKSYETSVVNDDFDLGSDEAMYQRQKAVMKELFKNQKRVQIMIPYGLNEKQGAYEVFCVNGYNFQIMKGVSVVVPETIAKLWADSNNYTLQALDRHRIDNDPDKVDALT